MKEKTYVEDVNRSIYDIKDEETDFYKVDNGLTPAIVEDISKEKNDPEWMRDFRELEDLGRLVNSFLDLAYSDRKSVV